MHPMLNTAVKAARAAAKLINRASMDLEQLKVGSKGAGDFVTETDQAAERVIIETLLGAYPDHAILAEESGQTSSAAQSPFEWIIDPIDGTANFIHGFPHYAIAIALRQAGQLSQAVIYDPVHDALFTASRGQGAFLNQRRIRVSRRQRLSEALIAVSYPATPEVSTQAIAKETTVLTHACAGVRRTGSAVMDLAYVAAGYLDGYMAFGLKPWDLAAGALMVQEAGGIVVDFDGESDFLTTGNMVAATPKILPALLEL